LTELVVLFYAYHASVAFEVVTHAFEQVQFVHCFLEFGDFFYDFAALQGFFGHVVVPVVFLCRLVLEGSSLFVGCPKGQSVIEEKGEGFENGKNCVGSFGLPSTSVFPPNYIARLKT